MAKLTKKQKEALSRVEPGKVYSLKEASELVKQVNYASFNASVDLDVRLGVDPRKANQMVRSTVTLPHGTGKEKQVLALCAPERQDEAKEAGADMVGLDDYLAKIAEGWTEVDVIVTTPDIMPKLGRYGKILGPRGLMPNPKAGTVTPELAKAIREVKAGKIDFKVDKYGIVHTAVGKVDFSPEKIFENAQTLISTISKLKPSAAKGIYFKNLVLSTTMSPGVRIDVRTVPGA